MSVKKTQTTVNTTVQIQRVHFTAAVQMGIDLMKTTLHVMVNILVCNIFSKV